MIQANTFTNFFTPTTITNTIIEKQAYTGSHPFSIFLFFAFTLMTLVYGISFLNSLWIYKEVRNLKDLVFTCVGISGLLTTILFLL